MLEPAKTVIDLCGGPLAVSRMVGVDRVNVYRWAYPKDRGGTGGTIPAGQQLKLLIEARRRGIDLRPEHFFPKETGATL